MANKKAILTLAIGEKYLADWKRLCQPNWQEYADKHGYDLICIDKPLDNSERAQKRSPAWQKCLILSQDFSANYEQIVWIDSDILINAALAPCIVKDVPVDKIGAVEEWSAPTPELFKQTLERKYEHWGSSAIVNRTAREVYSNYGLPPDFDQVVHSGVMVMSPQYHREILEKVYYQYEDKGGGKWNYEFRPLSWELLTAGCVHWIDYRFNAIWSDYLFLNYPFLVNQKQSRLLRKLYSVLKVPNGGNKVLRSCVTTAYINSFFLHFAGGTADMELVDLDANSWSDCKL
jgi:hypothetical protein